MDHPHDSHEFNLNLTRFEEDEFADIDSNNIEFLNETFQETHENIFDYPAVYVLEIASYIFQLLLGLAVLVGCIFLIVVLRKFNKLHTRTNSYILNYAILSLARFVLIPIWFIIDQVFNIKFSIYCCTLELHYTLGVLVFLNAFITSLDWFLSAYKNADKFFEKYYKHIILITYLLGIAKIFSFGYLCIFKVDLIKVLVHGVHWLLYIISLILVIIMYIIKRKRPFPEKYRKTEYSLTISLLILLSWLPLLFFHFIFIYTEDGTLLQVLILLNVIPMTISHGFPIVVIYLLGKLNKHFQMAYDVCFKRSLRQYENENIDEADSEIDKDCNGDRSGKVTYERSIDCATVIDA